MDADALLDIDTHFKTHAYTYIGQYTLTPMSTYNSAFNPAALQAHTLAHTGPPSPGVTGTVAIVTVFVQLAILVLKGEASTLLVLYI